MKAIIFISFLLSNCGVGYYKAESDHDVNADARTHKSTDAGYVCGQLLRHTGPDNPPTQRELDRYERCVSNYSENTDVVSPDAAAAASKFTQAQEPVQGGVN